jgi:pimeloyl-ACP methyl ester carboxylesterase
VFYDAAITVQRVAFDGIEIEYETAGAGEYIVFVHHGAGADWFRPLLNERALSARFSVLHYHRAGYAGSSALAGPITFDEEAQRLGGLMRALHIERAHVVGHSASGCMALQFALDLPETVHSVALLEPALMAVPSPPDVPRSIEMFRAGDRRGAVETFLRATCGANAPSVLEQVDPNAMAQALADSDTFFTRELPALRQWQFGPDEARRIRQPVLAVLGARSDSRFHQRQQLLLEWLPHAEPFVLAEAGHLLHLENPQELAQALAAFCLRHPISYP